MKTLSGAERKAFAKMPRLLVASALGLMLLGCDLPRDPEDTEGLIRARHAIRLGWVSGAEADPAAQATLARLARKLGARIERREDQSEILLSDLEKGGLDLVYGHFARSSPWSRKVHFGEAKGWTAEPPRHRPVPRFAMRNGENGWIMTVARASE